MSFVKQASYNTVSYAFSALLLLLAGVITARLLGPEGRGYYAVFFTLVGLLSRLLYFGLCKANIYYANREVKPFDQIFGNSILFLLFQGVLLFFVIVLFRENFHEIFPNLSTPVLLALMWNAVLLQTVGEVYASFLLAKRMFRMFALHTFLIAFVIFLATCSAYWYPENIEIVIASRVICFTVATFVFLLGFVIFVRPQFSFSWPLMKQQLNFGLKNYVQNIFGTLNYRLYLLLVSAMIGGGAAGLYSVAMLFAEPMRLLPNAVGPILLTHLTSEKCDEAHTRLTARTCRIILGMMAAGAIIYIPLTPFLLTYVFGEAYEGALHSVWIMILGGMIGSVFQVMTRRFTSRHQQRYSIISSVAALIVATLLAVLIIPEYGVLGGAIAYLASSIVSGFLSLYFYIKLTNISVWHVLLPQSEDFKDLIDLCRRVRRKLDRV
jgi:O-antigen/teichoic acid export membrane protein